MGTVISIEDEAAGAMASELAALTGESVDAAVIEAVRLRLEQERRKQDRDERVRQALAIAAEMRQNVGHPLPSSDHSRLYGEDGLPA